MGQKRAISSQQKARRRREILHSALSAYELYGYETVSMAYLAEKTGLAKGTLYLYFPTKESLFLVLCEEELNGWLDAVHESLSGAEGPLGDTALVDMLVEPLTDHPQLPSLISMLHTVLERNIDFERARTFRAGLLDHLTAVGHRLDQRVAHFKPGDGARFMLRVHASLIGFSHVMRPTPIVERVIAGPDYALYRRGRPLFDRFCELMRELQKRASFEWH